MSVEAYTEVSEDDENEGKDIGTEDSDADLIVSDVSLSSSTFSNISNISDDSYLNAASSYDIISSGGEDKFNENHDTTAVDKFNENNDTTLVDKFNESHDATVVDSSGDYVTSRE